MAKGFLNPYDEPAKVPASAILPNVIRFESTDQADAFVKFGRVVTRTGGTIALDQGARVVAQDGREVAIEGAATLTWDQPAEAGQ
jgi:hypothetical protein